jgi:hypothetical protein
MIAEEPAKIDQVQEETVQGKIIALNSERPDDQTVTILWERQERVRVSLRREDYQAACDAHKDNRPVSVHGKLLRRGKKSWTLIDPIDFRVE